MIPYLLVAIGGYFIGNSMKSQSFAKGGITNDGLWESVKEKFSQVYFEEEDDNEIYSNEVKAEEHKWMFDKYSPYASPLSWEDAKYKFLGMLTPEEKSIISIEENVRDVHELFGVMSEKKILVKRIKKMAKGGKVKKLYAVLRSPMGEIISDIEVETEDVNEALKKFREMGINEIGTIYFTTNEPHYYAKGGNVDDDLENFDVSQLDAYESMQYNHFIEKSKLSKKEALQVLINSVDGDYSQLNPKLRKIARKYRFGGEINKGDRFYYTQSGKKEFAVVEDVKEDNIDIFINHPESYNKGNVYSKDKHITVPRQEFRRYATPITSKFADGGDVSVASTILKQLGGVGRLVAMTGAYNFYDIGNGVSFKIKNPRANYIKIKLNGKDLYDVEIGRIRGTTYKVVAEQNDVYFDQLKGLLEKATGMYFSL